MWADRPSPAARKKLVERLADVLPPPGGQARTNALPFACRADPRTLAEVLFEEPGFLWLDRPQEALLGWNPIARLTLTNGRAFIEGPCGSLEWNCHGFDLVEAALEAWGGPAGAKLCGYLGYELGMELEGLHPYERSSADLPDLHLALYDWSLEYRSGDWQIRGTDAWREPPSIPEIRVPVSPPLVSRDDHADVASTPTPDGFRDSVGRTVHRIYDGELFQVNLCRRLETSLGSSEIWPLYLRMRGISPASHGAFIRTGPASAVLSVSPELFLSVRDQVARSCPIKGTRPRGATPIQDRALAAELSASEKDRAELAMIVDVTRNDLGRVCLPGSVAVPRHAELVSLPTVHHTYSEVTGRLRPECGPADLLRACFPPASISGAPKIRAMEVAAIEEPYRRGPCMGSIGWISLSGELELSVAIRTAVAADARVWYLAGCGITAGSVPDEELAESEAKAAAFLQAVSCGAV